MDEAEERGWRHHIQEVIVRDFRWPAFPTGGARILRARAGSGGRLIHRVE